MPSKLAFFILCAVVFVFFMSLGFSIGSKLGEDAVATSDYWRLNAFGAVGLAVGLIALPWPLVQAGVIGAFAGYVTGLKMGFGESVGPWKAVDRFFNVNRSHRKAAASGTGEARRRRKKAGAPEPHLISVDQKGKAAGPNGKNSQDDKR